MSEQEIISALLDASPIVALIVGFVAIVYVIAKNAPSSLDKWRQIEEVRNDGKKLDAAAQAQRQEASNKAIEIAVKAMQDTQERAGKLYQDAQQQQRIFYVEKLEDMRKGMSILEARLSDLEHELEEKDERIEELENENKRLHIEIDKLRDQLDSKEPRKKAKKGGDGNVPTSVGRAIGAGRAAARSV